MQSYSSDMWQTNVRVNSSMISAKLDKNHNKSCSENIKIPCLNTVKLVVENKEKNNLNFANKVFNR